MNSNCAVLVNSCDKYAEAWYPFFALFKKYWSDCPYPVYLNTETKAYSEQEVQTLNSNKTSWGSRLCDALNRIDSEYVILLFRRFFS